MRQSSYETILACIRYGAAATADVLMSEFNQVINNSNELMRQKAELEAKAKAEAEKKAIEAKKAEQKEALEKQNKK